MTGDLLLKEINVSPQIAIELRYSSTNNFLKKDIYGDFNQCLVTERLKSKIELAALELARLKPGWKLLFYDCWRPSEKQQALWDMVKGTPEQKYVADPKKISRHSLGLAVDVGLLDERGVEVGMGSDFDDFSPRAGRDYEAKLTSSERENRQLLRSVMEGQGLYNLPFEWWHFQVDKNNPVHKKP